MTKTSVLLTWEVPESYKSQAPLKVRAKTSNTYSGQIQWITAGQHVTFNVFHTTTIYKQICDFVKLPAEFVSLTQQLLHKSQVKKKKKTSIGIMFASARRRRTL